MRCNGGAGVRRYLRNTESPKHTRTKITVLAMCLLRSCRGWMFLQTRVMSRQVRDLCANCNTRDVTSVTLVRFVCPRPRAQSAHSVVQTAAVPVHLIFLSLAFVAHLGRNLPNVYWWGAGGGGSEQKLSREMRHFMSDTFCQGMIKRGGSNVPGSLFSPYIS